MLWMLLESDRGPRAIGRQPRRSGTCKGDLRERSAMKLWQYDPNSREAMFIANWSDDRARYYERETYRYLGIRPEPSYVWSRQYRPVKVRKRRSAEVLRPAKFGRG